MSFKAFLKRCLMQYFIIATCVTVAIALLGLSMDPAARFGYEAYFSPLIFAFISLLPSFVTYSRKELTFQQTLLRKVLYVIVLEGMLLVFGFWAGILHGAADALSYGVAVFIVYLVVNLISWKIDRKDADELNKTLKSMQGRS